MINTLKEKIGKYRSESKVKRDFFKEFNKTKKARKYTLLGLLGLFILYIGPIVAVKLDNIYGAVILLIILFSGFLLIGCMSHYYDKSYNRWVLENEVEK